MWFSRSGPAILALAMLVQGCAEPAHRDAEVAEQGRSLVDAAGRAHAMGPTPHRVLSLVPSATEVLLALGAEGLLVGRTDFDTLHVLAQLPSVGGPLSRSLMLLLKIKVLRIIL